MQVSSMTPEDIRERFLRYLHEGQALLRPIIGM
jgi:IclR family pca regulon transcriptional regulator